MSLAVTGWGLLKAQLSEPAQESHFELMLNSSPFILRLWFCVLLLS